MRTPGDLSWITFGMNCDFVAIDYQFTVLVLDSALESAVSGIILEHVDHVFKINEGIIDSDDLDLGVFEGGTQDNTANATETRGYAC